MTVHIRGDLAALQCTSDGERPVAAIRLDRNELPDGPLPHAVAAIRSAAEAVHRYPDPTAAALVDRIARHVGTTADRVTVGCGSANLCQHLVQATCDPDDEVVFGWPSFELYPAVARVVGARSRPVPTTAGHGLDLDGLLAAITRRTRLIFLCNPNNPTGTAVHRAELTRFLDNVPESVLVVLDEAYREFVTDSDVPDGAHLLQGRDNVAVLRTFSKAYGLAGMRIGYAIAAPEVITALRRVGVPFSVNSLAQRAAIASLDAGDELAARCRNIILERDDWVRPTLLAVGLEVPESHTNFLWLPLGQRTVPFRDHCLRHGVLVRGFAAAGVRVSIGEPQENDAFLAAAASFLRAPAPAAVARGDDNRDRGAVRRTDLPPGRAVANVAANAQHDKSEG